jgi:hypothetical protein
MHAYAHWISHFVHFHVHASREVHKEAKGEKRTPVVDRASIVVVIAWQVSIKLAHTHSPEQAVVCDSNLAPVILGADVVVVASSTERWDAYTDTEGSKLRLHRSAESWAPVALSEVVVTILSTDGASLFWRRDASTFIAVATAQATQHHHFLISHYGRFGP